METGNSAVVECFVPGQKPEEVDIPAEGLFDLPAGIDPLEINIYQDLKHHLGFDGWFSPGVGVGLIKTLKI